jgi:hypothetical protein
MDIKIEQKVGNFDETDQRYVFLMKLIWDQRYYYKQNINILFF